MVIYNYMNKDELKNILMEHNKNNDTYINIIK